MRKTRAVIICLLFTFIAGCASGINYFDPNMDFGAVRTVAVLPFKNLTDDDKGPDRVRDIFMGKLLATEALYVLPAGEVARGISRMNITEPSAPSSEEVKKLCEFIKAEAVITGVLREYGAVRSGTSSSNVISLSLQMAEAQTGKVVWSASSTKGGITIWDRLFGGGGDPMNDITEEAVNELIDKLFE
ncbi:MAG: GNA1162 family protein [Planctomycetota bacterium]|jgi:hypothetical protein